MTVLEGLRDNDYRLILQTCGPAWQRTTWPKDAHCGKDDKLRNNFPTWETGKALQEMKNLPFPSASKAENTDRNTAGYGGWLWEAFKALHMDMQLALIKSII